MRFQRPYAHPVLGFSAMAAGLWLCASAGRAEDRLWVPAKINGKPVLLAFDTAATDLVLYTRTAERLGLSWTNAPKGAMAKPGQVLAGITEECELRLSRFPDRPFRTRFRTIDLPAVHTEVEGVIGWSSVRNCSKIVLIDAGHERVVPLANIPADLTNWTRFNADTNCDILRLDPLNRPQSTSTIVIDTGSEHGVGLGPERWREWKGLHTNQPTTLEAYYSPAVGLVVAEESWAKRFVIGELALTEVPIREEADTADGPVAFGLAALRTLELIVDSQKGAAYLRSTGRSLAYEHNRLGAVFEPVNLQSQDLLARVVRDGPAWQAGIRDGDVLCRIGDLDATRWRTDPKVMPLSRFWARPAGTRLKLALGRDGKGFEAEVVLRQILPPDSTSLGNTSHE